MVLLDSPLVQATGSGGGGGGYAEAFFPEPLESTYPGVAEDGPCGIGGTGANAELSWFGIRDDNFEVMAGCQGGYSSVDSALTPRCLGEKRWECQWKYRSLKLWDKRHKYNLCRPW